LPRVPMQHETISKGYYKIQGHTAQVIYPKYALARYGD